MFNEVLKIPNGVQSFVLDPEWSEESTGFTMMLIFFGNIFLGIVKVVQKFELATQNIENCMQIVLHNLNFSLFSIVFPSDWKNC